jgi:hypothetical protein
MLIFTWNFQVSSVRMPQASNITTRLQFQLCSTSNFFFSWHASCLAKFLKPRIWCPKWKVVNTSGLLRHSSFHQHKRSTFGDMHFWSWLLEPGMSCPSVYTLQWVPSLDNQFLRQTPGNNVWVVFLAGYVTPLYSFDIMRQLLVMKYIDFTYLFINIYLFYFFIFIYLFI